ncbi:efflux RND transporter permease subunit [candidate division KSB1 bacterium]
MNIFKFVIERKTLISMLFLGLSLLGILSYNQLPLELMPNVESPYLIVQVRSSGQMDPYYVEKLAVIPVEGAINTLDGVKTIETSIQRQRGTINVYFDQNVNLEYAYLKMQAKINEILPSLPEEFRVTVNKTNTESLSNLFMTLQVRGSGGLERLRSIIDNSIFNELESIDGVSNVSTAGGEVKAVEILLDEEAAKAYNITPSRISSLISQNTERKTFVGNTFESDRHFFVNVVSDYINIQELENIIVNANGPVMLKDIATIVFGSMEQESISRVNGKDATTMQLNMDANVNLIDLSHTTRDVIDRLNRELAYQDIEIIIQTDSAEDMENNIDLIMMICKRMPFLFRFNKLIF